jgi:hypothetical protein
MQNDTTGTDGTLSRHLPGGTEEIHENISSRDRDLNGELTIKKQALRREPFVRQLKYCHVGCVTIDGIWIGDWIC